MEGNSVLPESEIENWEWKRRCICVAPIQPRPLIPHPVKLPVAAPMLCISTNQNSKIQNPPPISFFFFIIYFVIFGMKQKTQTQDPKMKFRGEMIDFGAVPG